MIKNIENKFFFQKVLEILLFSKSHKIKNFIVKLYKITETEWKTQIIQFLKKVLLILLFLKALKVIKFGVNG